MMGNMTLYDSFRSVPKEAQKTIAGGKLKGFTDINPMWRIKLLTQTFGPCGFGWYIDGIERWVEKSNEDEAAAFVKLNLYVNLEGTWSKPIVGIGGSKLVSYVNGKNGQDGYYDLNDEAFKMAYTDAISIACKALGMAADIYYNKDAQTTDNRTKHDMTPSSPAPVRRTADPASSNYQPMAEDRYMQCVAAEARGEFSKSGRTIRDTWIGITHADDAAIKMFDDDVFQYRINNNL